MTFTGWPSFRITFLQEPSARLQLQPLHLPFRCSVFLVERETEELVAKVFDGDVKRNDTGEILPVWAEWSTLLFTNGSVVEMSHTLSSWIICSLMWGLKSAINSPWCLFVLQQITTEVRIPLNQGIAGYVATTGTRSAHWDDCNAE